ncbi:unnamed protein product [Rotaria socialis]|uniref:Uncharacterized protein n=1 Tax=Rotaria socialis TaxID=392032 RepID=A0A818MQ73_9BILA|nr:unnamed protein product [Rotaria socialis]CAF3670859.1 unnamed protein product [Rotaria socialis]CAF4652311.1 unnamed protein product [Rotaria socialis]CAF4901790.1 unnamed protein product [Rotaria socialis]
MDADGKFPAPFFIEHCTRILQDERNRFGNRKALEFGGGPSLWPSFLLAQYVDSIRFCDYAKSNLNSVTDWIEQKPTAFDWTNYFESVLTVTRSPKEKRLEWEFRLRDALCRGGLSTCDVNDPNCPVLSGKSNDYDIIFSSLCLEAACLTIEIFNETIRRLVRLLKPGGLLLIVMVRNESFYYVDKEKFFCLPLDEANVENALHATGELTDIHIVSLDRIIDHMKRHTVSDYNGKMVIRAYKCSEQTNETELIV